MLTDEEFNALPRRARDTYRWGVGLKGDPFAEISYLTSELATALLARQRDRKRLRRVLARAKELRLDAYIDSQHEKYWREKWARLMSLFDNARRWSAAWKAAAKEHRSWHHAWKGASEDARRWKAERDELQQWQEGAMIRMDNLEHDYGSVKAERDLWQSRAAERGKLGRKWLHQRDEFKRKYEEIREHEGYMAKDIMDLEAERDELRGLCDTWTSVAESRFICIGELETERNELQEQLKAITNCILHYTPSDFSILAYDSAAEALAALLEEKDESDTSQ